MPLNSKQRELLIDAVMKYYAKHKAMIDNYKNAQEYAVMNYSAFADEYSLNDDRKTHYASAWLYMPEKYERKISNIEDRLIKYVIKYAYSMFGVKLKKNEAESIVKDAISKISSK